MSNSTRQGGYDERLVVPLEASRRGAHRARTNPLVAALPLLVVVIVVAAVIGVAYALFVKPSGDTSANEPLTSTTSPPATSAPATTQPSATSSKSSSSSSSSSASASTSAAAAVDKNVAVTVYNDTAIPRLAKRVSSVLSAKGFANAGTTQGKWTPTVSQTTVFYSKDSQSATAAAIVKALGFGKAEQTSKDTGGGITVVAVADADSVVP
jgi:LytR cell envelope-related transcriptional attenuator